MNALKKMGYGLLATGVAAQQAFATIKFDDGALDAEKVGGDAETADVAVQSLINRATVFLAVLAVVYALWGGFQIMTAAGDDKKVGSGKQIIMHAAIGLVVIFLAYSVVTFVLKVLFGDATTTPSTGG